MLEGQRDIPQYIVIEGPIGVGKTTLVNKLAQRYRAHTLLEIFEENPFLEKFYLDRERYAFPTEMFFLLSRYRQQEEFAQNDLFGRLSVSDYVFTKCRLFAGLTLSEHELALYDKVYTILAARAPKPDVVIYLHAPLKALLHRIKQRGRAYERDMDPAYLEQVCGLYVQFFQHYDKAPLLTIDSSNIDFTKDDGAVEAVMREATVAFREARKSRSAP
jgi:deoxyguanosine kinase